MANYIDRFVNRTEEMNRRLPADVSQHVARSCFSLLVLEAYHQSKAEGIVGEDFSVSIKQAIADMKIPIFYEPGDNKELPEKRQPSLVESIDATVDRFKVIDGLERIFADSASTMVYGGSMKYGPFLNVRSGTDASDIDAIIVSKGANPEEYQWLGAMETGLFTGRDKVTFMARLAIFAELVDQGAANILSQRFEIENKGYTMSTHIVPEDYLFEMYPNEDLESPERSRHKYVLDFKERPFERAGVSNLTMGRGLYNIPVHSRPSEGGFVVYNPAYSMIDGRYIPGMYQNITIPEPRFAFGADTTHGNHFKEFADFMKRREAVEKAIDPDSSLLKTEPRRPILPVYIDDIINP